jgi:carbonic anhydrase
MCTTNMQTRIFSRRQAFAAASGGLLTLAAYGQEQKPPSGQLSSAQSLNRLLAGNRRYRENNLEHPDQDGSRRIQLSKAQHPFAVILSCSDSRVPPEIVFDEGLGDLFVIRNAGHVVDKAVLGSAEYAVGHLNVPLIVVLGHSSCGAVKAAVDGVREAHLTSIVRAIRPATQTARHNAGDVWDNSVKENVRMSVRALSSSNPILNRAVEGQSLRVVGAHYDLATGAVTLVG